MIHRRYAHCFAILLRLRQLCLHPSLCAKDSEQVQNARNILQGIVDMLYVLTQNLKYTETKLKLSYSGAKLFFDNMGKFGRNFHHLYRSRDGVVMRALASHKCDPGFDSGTRRYHVGRVCFLPCSEGFFSGYSGFSLS